MNKKFLISILILFIVGCSSAGFIGKTLQPISQASINSSAVDITGMNRKHSELVVFAAASLTGAMREIGKEFEAANPDVSVSFNFAGSQILRTQLEQGASADVFASADHKNMDELVKNGMINSNEIKNFATNHLLVILPKDNPGGIQELQDLTWPGVKIILADESVPAGNYARQVLIKISRDPQYGVDFSQNILNNVVSKETDVKQVVAKVELGEADAGIVYVSDAVASPALKTISIPEELNVTASYPIASLINSSNPLLATSFVHFVLSTAGQSILVKWGFSGDNP
jgi:molybdate transport system substrate-binding protein